MLLLVLEIFSNLMFCQIDSDRARMTEQCHCFVSFEKVSHTKYTGKFMCHLQQIILS